MEAGGISYEDEMINTLCEKMDGKKAGSAGWHPRTGTIKELEKRKVFGF